MQKALTDEAVAVANRKISEAMLASGPAPKFLYRNDYRAIHVKKGDPWHGINRPHRLEKCDQTIFCVSCRCTSSGNRTKWLHDACKPTDNEQEKRPKHVKDMVDRALLKGKCPYRGNWRFGLDRKILWPPCDVWIYEEYNLHHT